MPRSSNDLRTNRSTHGPGGLTAPRAASLSAGGVLMKRRAGMLLLVACVAALTLTGGTGTSAAGDKKLEDGVLLISANDLLKDYKSNQVGADAKYKGKTLRVKGKVR